MMDIKSSRQPCSSKSKPRIQKSREKLASFKNAISSAACRENLSYPVWALPANQRAYNRREIPLQNFHLLVM